MRTQQTPRAVATAALIDACHDLAHDLVTVRIDVGRAAEAAVRLAGEAALSAGARGRLVRFACGQPRRETCRLGAVTGARWRRVVMMEEGL